MRSRTVLGRSSVPSPQDSLVLGGSRTIGSMTYRFALSRLTVRIVGCGMALCVLAMGCEPSTDKKESTGSSTATATANSPPPSGSVAVAEKLEDSADYPLPEENTVEKLIEYLNMLANQEPPQNEQYQATLTKIMEARVIGAKRLAKLENNSELQSHLIAAETQLESLRLLALLDAPTASERRDAYTASLLKSDNPEVSRVGRLGTVQNQIDRLQSKGEGEPEAIAAAVAGLLEKEDKDQRLFYTTSESAKMLAQIGHPDLGIDLLKKVGAAFADSADMKLATQGANLLDQTEVFGLQRALATAARSEEGGLEEFEQAFQKILERPTLSSTIVSNSLQLLQQLEYSGHVATAQRLYEAISKVTDRIPEPSIREETSMRVANANKRLTLVGNSFQVDGMSLDGSAFDWSAYAGKVVLVDFWATWCGPCIKEIPNIRQAYEDFHDQGFEVVGVNMDDDPQEAAQFVKDNSLPWTTVVAGENEKGGFENPNAVRCGVEGIPFLVLVGRDGKVVALHTRGPELALRVSQLINEGEPSNTDNPESTAAEPSGDPAATDSATEPAPDAPAEPAADATPAAADAAPASDPPVADAPPVDAPPATETPGEGSEATEGTGGDDSPTAGINPYDPPDGLDARQLVDFLLDREDKPRSIQFREGFTAGVMKAADQILQQESGSKFREIAATTKLKYLHRDACLGLDQADQKLQEAVAALQGETEPKIADEVAFFLAERRAIESSTVADDQLETRIEELQQYFKEHQSQLSSRHLRMASAMVDLVNRVADSERREKVFQEFGTLLASSGNKSVALYGRRLAKTSPAGRTDLVGKPLELVGTSDDGQPIAWESYRGQVVLVDFWATWCGPCRAAMPELIETLNAHQEQGLRVLGVNLDEDQEALAQFLETTQLPWSHLIGEGASQAADRYGVRGIPTLILVDRAGQVVAVDHQLAKLREAMDKLLADPS